ncbi:MAG: fibronectin type III domain-containing protein [Bacteroidales bacterium]|nr:fibronectin type III domain-containing protein [Bacteroidales bacterium]
MKQTYCFFSTFAHRVLTVASARAKLLTLIALCLFSVGNVWAIDVTINYSAYQGKGGASGTGGSATATINDITITSTKAYYTNGHVREYKDSNITISAPGTITKIVVTGTTDAYANAFGSGGCSVGTWDNGTWTGNSNSVKFTTGTQARWTKIVVTYEPASSYKVTAVAYPTDGGRVSFEGNKITATPNTGWQISTTNPPYTVTDGTATVEQSGNEFTVTPSSDCTVQINFEKEPTYTLTYYEGNTSTAIEVAEGANILEVLKDITPKSCDATSIKFVGWAANPITGKQSTCPDLIAENATITSDRTVYAVFAKAEGTSGLTQMKTGETLAEGDNIVIFATTMEDNLRYALYQKSTTSGYIDYWETKSSNGPTAAEIDDELKYVTVTAGTDGKWILGDAANGYLYNSSSATMNVTVSNKSEWTITDNRDDTFYFTAVQRLSCRNDLSSNKNTYRGGGAKNDSGVMKMKVYKYVKPTFSDYLTMCDPCEDLNITWSNMQATDVVRQTATLSWGMSSTEHVTGYRVHVWSTSSSVYDKTFTVEGAATTTLNLTDLSRETTYNWTVTALTEHGWCTTTSDEQQFVTIGAEQLPAPGNPKVVYNPETDKYTFSWDEVTGAKEYKMTGQFSGTIKGTSSERTLDLIPGKEYSVTVQAIGDGDNYTNSETASVTFTAHTYTLTLSVTDNGTTTTKTFTLPKVTLPAETSMCEASEGWTFAGWSETDIAEESTTTAPALIAAGTEYGPNDGYIKENKTLYAVFSKTEEGENAGLYYLSESNYYIGAFDSKYFKAVSTTQDAVAFGIEDGKYLYAYVNGIKTYYSHTKSGETDITSATTNPKEWTITETGTTIQLRSTAKSTRYLGYSTGFRAYAASHTLKKLPATTTLYTTSPSCTDCNDPNNHCPEYPLVLNDRGVETTMDSYWVGEQILEPVYTPQGDCAGYKFEGWTTEAGLSNLTAEEWVSKKVTFPIKMPKKAATDGKLTLYAVYSSTLTDEYRLVTDMNELTTGEYVITALAENQEHALSFVRSDYIENFGSQPVEITKDDNGIDIVSTTNPEIIWTITQTEGGYTLEALHFDGMAHPLYLNIVSNYLQFEEMAKPYTITKGETYAAFTLCSSEGYCMSYNGTDFVADETASKLYLYKRVQDIRYSTSTHCDPSVIGVGTVAVTSAQGIWVEAVTQPYVYAERLTQNRDDALVDIIASTASSSPFTLKAVGATGVGDHSIPLVSDERRDNFAGRFKVVYTPKQTGGIDKDRITVKVTKAGDPATVYATHTFEVQGRSLPGEFVIAAQTADGWVALPADLGNSSLAYLKAPYSIKVDNEADPTKATQAPQTAVYHAAMRFHEDINPRGVRLLNSRDESLCGDYSKDPDHRLWFDGGEVTNSQSWALRSLALKDYYIRLQAAPAGHYLFYNATTGGGKIGYYEYKQQNRLRLRLLPVETTCVRYDAPDLQVGQLKLTSVTLEWPKIQNATGYEYSLDEGATWIPFVQGTDWTIENGMNIGTIDGLAAKTRYTVWVRVAVGESENNCSEVGVRTFTMPECDDAPHNLWASATADAVTIVWEAASPTATVKIYSDEAGTTLFKEQESGATDNHQCRITGLEQNKKYWYRVFSAGTCGSAIASFTTESKDISIVEWEKDAVIVDINTEVANGVSVVVEKRVEHGEHNYADDLFFSKYYEATGDVKLLGIYNGTPNTVSLSGYKIYIGKKEGEKIGQWDYTVDLSTIGDGVIEPNEEILLWRHIASDNTQVGCIEGKIDVKNMIENSSIIFGGRNAIVLSKDNVPIDVMGGISEGETMDDILPANCTHEKPSWGDQNNNTSWNGWGYSIEDPTQKIELSMNRCLLVRRNHVKSGKNAVEKNRGIAGFLTLGNEEGVESEWLGRQVPKGDNDWKVSCEGFSYVADFDYSNYYVSYDKVEETKFNGTPNENGTYTITVPNLPQLACTDIRLQLTKNGEVTASVEQKVPIIVTEDANTTGELFSANGLTPEVCKTCDVVVRDKSRLTHATGQTEFRNMFIYHDSELEIAAGTSLTLDKLRMFALNDSVSYAIINNTNDADNPTITVNEVSHVKRIDGRYWYPFSLPYDCYISQISALNGKSLGKYGTDWCIKYYNGEQRQKDGTSAAIGQVSQYWEKLGESEKLEAYKGYIIGLYCPTAEEAHQKSVHFAPARQSVYTETGESKTTDVHNWPDNLEAEARHHGWNFTGSPYISLFGVNESGDGLFNDQLKMGYTDVLTGEQLDKEHVYLSIPDGKDRRTYTQVLASATTVKPFTAYFVQTIDPTDQTGHTLELTYQKARRTFPGEKPNQTLAPRRAAERDAVLFAEINLTDNAAGGQDTYLRDNTGVLVSDRFSADYEIGDDLTKMYAAAGKPQLYTMAGNEKMAYNALPDGLAHNLPLGIYVPKAGEYTLSLNRHASRLENAEAVYLLHSGIIVADLLLSDYTILATAKGEQTGYMLDIRRATKVVTGTEQVATDEPYAIMCDGQLTIGNLPTASDVAIYDALGRLVWSEQQATTPVVADLPQTGVYMVLITSGEQQYVLKSLNR